MAIFGDDSKKTKEMTDAIVEGISATIADSVTKAMQPVFTELAGELKNALGESKAQQAQASADLAEAVRGMQKLMEGMAAGMQTLQKVTDSQQAVLERLAEVQKAQEATQKSLTKECEEVFGGIREAQQKLASTYDDITKGSTALVAREEGVVKTQKQVLDKATEDLLSLQTKWTDNVTKANAGLTSTYDKMFKEMESTIASLKTYTDTLGAAGTAMNTACDTFSKKLDDTLTGFDTRLGGALDGFASKTGEALTGFDTRLGGALDGFNSKTDSTLTGFGTKTGAAFDAFSKQLDSTLTDMNKGFDTFSNRMEGAVSGTFDNIDKQLGSAVSTLGKTTEEINEAVAKIPKALRGLN